MSSVRDRVRARREALSRQRNEGEMFMLPGYDGELWVHLAYMTPDENRAINDRHGDGMSVQAMSEKLVVATRGLYESQARTREAAVRIEHDGVPVGWDRDFAAWFGMLDEVTVDGAVDPVDVLRAVMPKEFSIEALHDAWAFWLQFSSRGVDDALMGESGPTPT